MSFVLPLLAHGPGAQGEEEEGRWWWSPAERLLRCLRVPAMEDPACPEPLLAPLPPAQLPPSILTHPEGIRLLSTRETTRSSFDRSLLPQLPRCRPRREGLLKQKPHCVGCAGEMTLMVCFLVGLGMPESLRALRQGSIWLSAPLVPAAVPHGACDAPGCWSVSHRTWGGCYRAPNTQL